VNSGEPMRSAEGTEAVEFEGHLVLIGRRRRALLVLNETARIIWETIRAGVGAEEMPALLAQGYGIPLARATADVEAVLDQWRAHGLLNPVPDEGTKLDSDAADATPPHAAVPVRPALRIEHVYNLCGTAFRLRVEPSDVGCRLHLLLAYAETPRADARDVLDLIRAGADHVLVHNGRERHRHSSPEAAAGSIVRTILDFSYPDADWSLFIHAAAVACGDQAVVLVGTNGAGKSTLTAALIASGLGYFSDDVVPLDGRTMRVMPVPFAISVKEGSWPVLSRLYPALRTLPIYESGGRRMRYLPPSRESRPDSTGAAVKALVFLRHEREERSAALTPLSPLQALVKLADTHCLMPLERDRLGPTLDWIRTVPAFELIHGNLHEATGIVHRLL
jgi:hypothetical protein